MTRIHLTPLLQDATGRIPADATLLARASFPFRAAGAQVVAPTVLRWEFEAGGPVPVIELAEPDQYAWLLHLTIGTWTQTRAVMFVGAELDWAQLTDVDPSTLTQQGAPAMPDGSRLITRAEVAAAYVTKGTAMPTLPSGTEYVWMKTDGAGTLLDIVSGVA